jgi:hypothetical protein
VDGIVVGVGREWMRGWVGTDSWRGRAVGVDGGGMGVDGGGVGVDGGGVVGDGESVGLSVVKGTP